MTVASTSQDHHDSSTAGLEDRDKRPAGGGSSGGRQLHDRGQMRSGTKKSGQVCRFHGTKKGCRAQEQCPYLHVQPEIPPTQTKDSAREAVKKTSEPGPVPGQNVTLPSASNGGSQRVARDLRKRTAVTKPVSTLQQQDPREFQIRQVVTRYSASREDDQTRTGLTFKLRPSDPDFPFELEALECNLSIPATYPRDGRPTLRIRNEEIPRGFQINVERGFESLCSASPVKTLLQLLNDLDRNLEKFLTSEKAQTIKIVANRGKADATSSVFTTLEPTARETPLTAAPPTVPHSKPMTPPPTWTAQQKVDAQKKRDIEVRQLEARMSRVPLFSSSGDKISFNVPLQIPKPSRLPLPLQALKQVTMIVPKLYDLDPCRIKLKGVTGDEAEHVELAFEKHVVEHRDMSLMAHINYLTQNIHVMANSTSSSLGNVLISATSDSNDSTTIPVMDENQQQHPQPAEEDVIVDEERPHLRFLSHPPPEWSRVARDDETSDSETSDENESDEGDSDVSDGAESQAGGAVVQVPVSTSSLEKGVLLSFPYLELHGIELLQIQSLSLVVKCDRCKDSLDVKNIKPAEASSNLIRTESCNKCANPISVSFRAELMHTNSIKAGFLDLEGCTVVDMLPSYFLPTCSECSTLQPAPGVISVRGEAPMAVCRECHHRLNLKMPEVKFLRVSSNDARLNLPLRSKRKKENLGIQAGTELPDRGRCKHYTKSYRWFRFSCCSRVYPCDRCHDEKEEHPNEHANRMICGWCSREQNYRPEDCSSCGRSVIRKTGGGFWEGGKGTRDKAKMSRKDPRKYKRLGASTKGGDK